jgi:hypothetical protein
MNLVLRGSGWARGGGSQAGRGTRGALRAMHPLAGRGRSADDLIDHPAVHVAPERGHDGRKEAGGRRPDGKTAPSGDGGSGTRVRAGNPLWDESWGTMSKLSSSEAGPARFLVKRLAGALAGVVARVPALVGAGVAVAGSDLVFIHVEKGEGGRPHRTPPEGPRPNSRDGRCHVRHRPRDGPRIAWHPGIFRANGLATARPGRPAAGGRWWRRPDPAHATGQLSLFLPLTSTNTARSSTSALIENW